MLTNYATVWILLVNVALVGMIFVLFKQASSIDSLKRETKLLREWMSQINYNKEIN